jgi:hypothetical protein
VRLKIALRSLMSLLLCMVFVQWANPFGLAQRLFWGMRPPYYWVQNDVSQQSPGGVDEFYIGVNGRACANVYYFPTVMVGYTVYGYGFREEADTRPEAEALAARECR